VTRAHINHVSIGAPELPRLRSSAGSGHPYTAGVPPPHRIVGILVPM